MDTTLRYIKMCEKSPLQKLWESKSGDWVIRKYLSAIVYKNKQEVQILIRRIDLEKNTYWVIVNENGESRLTQGELHKKFFTCLFRQDQLQEMVGVKDGLTMGFYFGKLFKQLIEVVDNKYSFAESMEQLWHVFVVYELYDKIWNNKKEKWVIKEEK